MAKSRIVDLEREIKLKNERIEELREEVDETRDLVRRMSEHVEAGDDYLDNFITAFGLTLNDAGEYTNDEFLKGYHELAFELDNMVSNYNKVVREYNDLLHLAQRHLGHGRPVGRPIAASEAQQAQVLQYHREGRSLRWIAETMTLSRRTVHTIVEKGEGSDRTTTKRRLRLGLEPVKKPKRRKWILSVLPKQATALREEGRSLIKEAKGLGRAPVGK